MSTHNEPVVIATLIQHRLNANALFDRDEQFVCQASDILAAYDAIVAERDEWRDAAKWSEGQHQYWKTVAEAATAQRDAAVRERVSLLEQLRLATIAEASADAEADTLRARLAACERVVEAAKSYYDATVRDEEWEDDVDLAYEVLMDTVGFYRAAVATAQGEA